MNVKLSRVTGALLWWRTASEKKSQKAILDLLADYGIRAGKFNSGGRYLKAHMLLASPLIDNVYTALWIDCRRSDVGHPKFQQYVEGLGQRYLLAHSPDDVSTWLKENGVIRGK